MRLVLIDTCIWVPFFNRPQSAEKKTVDALLDDDRVALIGPIAAEILQGIPRDAHADYVASLLRGIRYLAQIGKTGSKQPASVVAVPPLATASRSATSSSPPLPSATTRKSIPPTHTSISLVKSNTSPPQPNDPV